MKFRALLLGLLLVPLFALAAGFPHQESDLPPDPAVRWGRLDNGLHYAILPNPEPRGRASLRLAIAAGSFHETDAQRGLAHFLEHMAFNGSRHFPAANVVEFFQRLGMNFGGDTNASTSFDRTIYQLELPDTKPATFGEALDFFTDVAGGLLLEPIQIDHERGIIESERRARDSVGYRAFLAEIGYLLPDTLLPKRVPIGVPEVVTTAPREAFADFYDAWYRPERMTLVVVGEVDAPAVEQLLRERFSALAVRAPARPAPGYGAIGGPPAVTAFLHSDRDAGSTTVALETVVPYQFEADTAANRLKYLPRTLALQMLNRRLSILAKQEGAPFLGGLVGITEQFDFYRNASLELNCRPDQWRAALGVAEQELRRALRHGFESAELAEATAGYRNALEQAVRGATTRRSNELADELTGSLLDRNVFTHPAAELALFAPALNQATPAACLAALRAVWGETEARRIFISGNLTLADPEKEILAAYQASSAVAVEPPAKTEQAAFAYTDFGPAGTVVSRRQVEDLGLTLVEFQNGVRLNLKPTDFEAGQIQLSLRLGGGTLTQPAGKPGLNFLANSAFTAGGLGRHSIDELQRILAGKTLGLSFSARPDAFVLGGRTNRDDFLLQLQLLCAYVTDPGYRPEALRQVRKSAEQLYARLEHDISGPLQTEVPRQLAGGDFRFGLPARDAVLALTLDDLKAWLTPELAHGALEIAVVGDLDPDAVIAAVAKTFGALPARSAKPSYDDARRVAGPAAALARQFAVPTEIPKAVVSLHWPATDARDVRVARRLRLLSEVFSDRLRVKIREELGGTYSPEAGADLSDTYPGFGYLVADAVVAPAQAREIADAIKAVAADLYTRGVTAEELQRAKEPVLTQLRESSRTNGYWLANVLSAAQEQPQRLDWCRTRYSDNEAITLAELTALAKQYLDPAKVHEFISQPAAKP
jgi:zinc protease